MALKTLLTLVRVIPSAVIVSGVQIGVRPGLRQLATGRSDVRVTYTEAPQTFAVMHMSVYSTRGLPRSSPIIDPSGSAIASCSTR